MYVFIKKILIKLINVIEFLWINQQPFRSNEESANKDSQLT